MRAYAVPNGWSRFVLVMTVIAGGVLAVRGTGGASPADRYDAVLRHTIAHLYTVSLDSLPDGSLRHRGATATWRAGPIQDGMRTVTIVTRLEDPGSSRPDSPLRRITVHRFAGTG